MPLFEYECRDCGRRFEALSRGDAQPRCRSCDSDHVDKVLSVFAIGNGQNALGADNMVGPCGTCGDPRGPGACSVN